MKETNLLKIRKRLRIKQVDLAKKLHVSSACICALEKQGVVTVKMAYKIAQAIGCPWQLIIEDPSHVCAGKQ